MPLKAKCLKSHKFSLLFLSVHSFLGDFLENASLQPESFPSVYYLPGCFGAASSSSLSGPTSEVVLIYCRRIKGMAIAATQVYDGDLSKFTIKL